MTRENVYQILNDIGYPLAYEIFGEGQTNDPPYMVYSFPQSSPFYADGEIYCEIDRLQVDLYTRVKDPEAERKVEAALTRDDWSSFRKRENYYPSEDIFEITYELEVSIDYGE